jgi:hypothetical protein
MILWHVVNLVVTYWSGRWTPTERIEVSLDRDAEGVWSLTLSTDGNPVLTHFVGDPFGLHAPTSLRQSVHDLIEAWVDLDGYTPSAPPESITFDFDDCAQPSPEWPVFEDDDAGALLVYTSDGIRRIDLNVRPSAIQSVAAVVADPKAFAYGIPATGCASLEPFDAVTGATLSPPRGATVAGCGGHRQTA